MTKWTNSQEEAIKSKGSVLVSASAGTGKTAVLTEKVVTSLINENINIDEMIIMTFSTAAASQMKERIKDRIIEIINDPSTDRNKKNMLWKQIRMFNDSHIQTIHAFCNELIKKYFYIINVDPNIRVADTFDVAILKNKAIKEVMSLEYQLMDENFIALEEMIDDTETIEEMFIKSYDKIVSFIDYRNWLKESIEKYNITEMPDFIINMIISDFNKSIENYKKAIELINDENNNKLDKIEDTFKTDLMILENIRNNIVKKNISNITNELNDFGGTVRFPNGNDYDDIKNMRNQAKDLIVSKYKKLNFDFEVQVNRIKEMYPILKKFYQIFIRFDDAYNKIKNEKKIIDFNDMEKYAHKILQNDNISDECKNMFRRVFIDEYQDTNPIQESIIDRISSIDNLFCVGDLKQSIYRFRSSDPTLFLQRSEKYSMNLSLGSIISLNNNFRSAQNILDCSNDIFNYITSTSKEIDYTEDDKLIHGRTDDEAQIPVEIELLSESFRNIDTSSDEYEIYNMVKIIKNNIGKDIYDPEINEYRKIEYKDFAILCRKLTGLTDSINQIFNANNIPFVIERSGQLFETTEAQIMLNIIDLINNPKDDMKLLSLMHLGLFDFTDDDIINIKKKIKNSYYDKMIELCEDSSDISLKCSKMFSFFDNCREKQKYLSLTTIINYIISELNIYDIFSIMKNGTQRIANIKEFLKHAHDYEEKYSEKLYGFANYIHAIIDSNINVDEGKINYDENSVKITTIHKSKGLEYPIVILGFCGKQFNRMDKRANIVLDKDCGIGVRYYNHEKKQKGKCILRTYIENEIDDKNVEEEMRLLYVAMTRAKEKLYITGTVSDTISFNSLEDSSNFINWIMYVVSNSYDFANQFGNVPFIKLNGKWNVHNVSIDELSECLKSEVSEISLEDINNQFNVFTKIENKSDVKFEEYVPLVMSASIGLKKSEINKNMLCTPDFIKKDNDALYLGTVIHEFLKNIDFKNCNSINDIESEKNKLIEKNIMNIEDINNVDIEKIYNFFKCELGQFIISCNKYYKEKYINIIKDATEVGFSEKNDILIRCIVDLVCEKDGKYYLVDYKTDKINNVDDEKEIKEKALTHKKQLDIYKDALKEVYSIDIEKTYIAFVNYGVYSEI